jgi:transcriptional regulator with XRE-family HTH domain
MAAIEQSYQLSNNLGMSMAARITQARRKLGLKQVELARLLDIHPVNISQWEKGRTQPDRDRLPAVAKALETSVDWLMSGDLGLEPNALMTEDKPTFVPDSRDFPVLGTAECGDGTFALLGGDPIDHVNRPSGLAFRRDAYGVYVQGQSMQPAHDPGDLVYVDPRRPPMVGRDCIIQLKQKTEDGAMRCMLKRLVKRTAHKWIFQQFNPVLEITIDNKDIHAVHLVLKAHETNLRG